MKTFSTLLLAAALTVPTFAQPDARKAPPSSSSSSGPTKSVAPTLPASAAVVKAPIVLKDGAIGQPEVTELGDGGKAVFDFTVAQAGDYVIHAVVAAPDDEANSFFLNIDAPPEDPAMIWDIEVTNGFEARIVSWRGKGDADSDEFKPKRFKLSAGAHKLFLVGREPAQLKSVSIQPAGN